MEQKLAKNGSTGPNSSARPASHTGVPTSTPGSAASPGNAHQGHAQFKAVMSPLARTSSNPSLSHVVTPSKMASLLKSRRGSSASDLRHELLKSENPRRGSATGSYGLPVPPDALQLGGSSLLRSADSLPVSRNDSGRNSPSLHHNHAALTQQDKDTSDGVHFKNNADNLNSKISAFTSLYNDDPEIELPATGIKKLFKMFSFGISGDAEGPGCCATLIALVSILLLLATLPFSLFFTVKVVKEYERAVIFRLGRLRKGGAKGPGIFFIIPCVDTYNKVDLRTVSFDVPPQEILSRDSVTVSVDAVVYYRVSNPTMATNNVEDYRHSTHLLAATTLRNVLGTKCLAQILSEREQISHYMETSLDEATDPWGVKVERVEIKDVRLPVQLQRAMAAEAEAAREARAKIITAEGEKSAAQALRNASEIITGNPAAMQLRFLQTLNSISAEKNSTIIFPVPLDILSLLSERRKLL